MRISKLKLWLATAVLLIAALGGTALSQRPDGHLHVYFLDVGQGDATLVRMGTFDILIDGGPSPQAITNELGRILPFWDRTIELVVLTHPHTDHLAGLVEVLRRYNVNMVLYPDTSYLDANDYSEALFAQWLELIETENIEAVIAYAGMELNAGGITLSVLHPPDPPMRRTNSDINNNSVVLRVEVGSVSFLITGDLQREGEAVMASANRLEEVTVLKVGHHGSRTSTLDAFLDAVAPQIAVISVGENSYGHPTQEVLDRLTYRIGAAGVYRTDRDGTIEFITDGRRLWVRLK
ncbi:MAG: MBL fold metallo-hydrolase [Dehalococcoidia bacterium]|nr:MBL fold metallo-hydrolase [Dehalococcoidia bacterium]